ncbi:ADP-forming succinate--CoA ligase subunit beta [Bdellovibrio bacteriovorus]|uniref:Succinate--CoA ligase [ADP-forming] subunit beta n=1 Tax=Bdellovibrio bacteriovorus TaxID=959 RepID=A0A150WWC2_BDEBC|nr:ADP-forming succinate--CoA ligase subunit beta [Bdellovibrio bacteriovorus]KYG70781.1 succinate--CoA ligase subunit beta [Bdellovibrio bacteriovorus]
MNIHEYQAKEILRKFGVATLKGKVAHSPEEAVAAAKEIGGNIWVVKAQIHAGGRGKGGGVKIAKTLQEVEDLTKKMIGMTLVTHQTGPEGKVVQKVFIEQGCNIAKEYYVACLIDRATGRAAMMASSEGGMDIEEVAEHNPNAIKKVDIDPTVGLMPFQARQLAFQIGMSPEIVNKAVKFFQGLYNAFITTDCSIAEINPLVVTKEGEVLCLDAKMNFDSNALFRHQDIVELRDLNEEEPSEIEASKYDLAFIKLDGNIGCLVNGAGLAMATLDIIKLHGASPANFLDVGGGANKEKVTAAFKIILKDPNVKGILVNIFGGIMKCDIIAEGVIAASKELGLKVPLVCRLEGTNVELGKKMLRESGLNITPADDLTDAAKKIVAAVKG